MAAGEKRAKSRNDPAEQELREQEVLRANKELAAYFKGQRTEREARAALKIIKAFIRDRERIDAASRRPLPGAAATAPAKSHRKAHSPKKVRQVSTRRRARHKIDSDAAAPETSAAADLSSGTDE